jgi:hypothetical protein
MNGNTKPGVQTSVPGRGQIRLLSIFRALTATERGHSCPQQLRKGYDAGGRKGLHQGLKLAADRNVRAPARLSALLALLFLTSTAHAFPPGPYHLLYGTVRDRYGTPLTTANSQVIFQSPSGAQFIAPVIPGLRPGVNYQIKVPMDSGAAPDIYAPNVQVPTAPFKLVVVVNGVTNLPMEMTTNFALGQWTKTTRIDLTLGSDSNGDGIPDAWEYAFLATLGLNIPLSSLNANSVLTPDGLTLRQQYLLGTYPFDPGDPLKILLLGFNGNAPILQFPTVAGRSYTVLSSSDLKNWNPVSFNLSSDAAGSAGRAFYAATTIATIQVTTAPPPPGTTRQFYKIMVQ